MGHPILTRSTSFISITLVQSFPPPPSFFFFSVAQFQLKYITLLVNPAVTWAQYHYFNEKHNSFCKIQSPAHVQSQTVSYSLRHGRAGEGVYSELTKQVSQLKLCSFIQRALELDNFFIAFIVLVHDISNRLTTDRK